MESIKKILKQHSYASLNHDFFSKQLQQPLNNPFLIHVNKILLNEFGLSERSCEDLMLLFNGSIQIPDVQAISMNYAGHQFGQYVPQLGDGRGVLLGEIKVKDKYLDIHVKGSGKTPYSRFGDGRAVLRSSLREYLCGEAMHGLGIPSSRSLMIFGSDDIVYREKSETAAMIARTAETHIRFGSFEKFYHDGLFDRHKELCNYAISQYFPDENKLNNKYSYLLENIVTRTASLIANWQSVGFCHGVMNTDNMSILGETLDYGPFGFIDNFNPSHICNLSDSSGRYSYQNQPYIGMWNCSALAHTFENLISKEEVKSIMSMYEKTYTKRLFALYKNKLGLNETCDTDELLVQELLNIMEVQKLDFTRTFRSLSNILDANNSIEVDNGLENWSQKFKERHDIEITDINSRIAQMNQINPKFILRNYLLQNAIDQAEEGSYKEIDILMKLITNPYEENLEYEKYAQKAPEWATSIGLSCSS
tara:strand:- start:13651 stop:15084 length:1434 start_codon:yes stop_codon:yes gene_type:complete